MMTVARSTRRGAWLLVLSGLSCARTTEECVGFVAQTQGQVDARFGYHASGCRSDSDCTMLPASLMCFEGCPKAVLASQQSALQAELDALSQAICPSAPCQPKSGCYDSRAVCMAGECRTLAGVVDAGAADAGRADGG